MSVPVRPITTIDLLKTFAVFLMVIDHMGFYFFVESMDPLKVGDPNLWWRVVGRFCVPIWFFLIGYARSRTIDRALVGGMIFLELASIATGMFVFPLNVLGTMIVARMVIDPLARFMFSGFPALVGGLGLLLFFYGPSSLIVEYGTLGILIALAGYVVRHNDAEEGLLKEAFFRKVFLWGLALVSCGLQLFIFSYFSVEQFFVMTGGMLFVYAVLFYIPFSEYPALTAALPKKSVSILQFVGRQTLMIYVVHLTLFKVIALVFGIGYPLYGWFDWEWTVHESFRHGRGVG